MDTSTEMHVHTYSVCTHEFLHVHTHAHTLSHEFSRSLMFKQKACVCLVSAQTNTPLSPSYWSPLICSSTGHALFLLTLLQLASVLRSGPVDITPRVVAFQDLSHIGTGFVKLHVLLQHWLCKGLERRQLEIAEKMLAVVIIGLGKRE